MGWLPGIVGEDGVAVCVGVELEGEDAVVEQDDVARRDHLGAGDAGRIDAEAGVGPVDGAHFDVAKLAGGRAVYRFEGSEGRFDGECRAFVRVTSVVGDRQVVVVRGRRVRDVFIAIARQTLRELLYVHRKDEPSHVRH